MDNGGKTYRPQHPGFREILRGAWQRSRGSLSLWLVGVCVVFFLVVAGLDICGIVSRGQSAAFLGLSYVGVAQRHWLHQFATAPLIHGGIAHLLFNMLSLWMLGPSVEKALGRWRYAAFSALCAGCSMAGSLAFNWGTGTIVMGYSGVIFGILVAQAVLFPNNVIAIFAFFPLKMKYAALLLGAVELYLTVLPEGGGVAHAAHLFGAVAAAVWLLGGRGWRAARMRMQIAAAQKRKRRPLRQRDMKDIPREL